MNWRNEERKEVYRILRELTAKLSVYSSLLSTYHEVVGDYDFIRAKAKLAVEIRGEFPLVTDKAHVHLVQPTTPYYFFTIRKRKSRLYR
jgi:DNA mismatch repair protein MutS2